MLSLDLAATKPQRQPNPEPCAGWVVHPAPGIRRTWDRGMTFGYGTMTP
jgi:hypothetical protein